MLRAWSYCRPDNNVSRLEKGKTRHLRDCCCKRDHTVASVPLRRLLVSFSWPTATPLSTRVVLQMALVCCKPLYRASIANRDRIATVSLGRVVDVDGLLQRRRRKAGKLGGESKEAGTAGNLSR